MNDPNGPIWHRDRLHMFFQYSPSTPPRSQDVVWGHCSSSNLVDWQLDGVALAPSTEHPGTEEFWSGNTVECDGRLVAFYSAQRDGDPFQLPHMTVSQDGGNSFTGDWSVVPRPAAGEGVAVLRDPFVWSEGGRWRMLVASGSTDGAPQVLMYESTDLRSWSPRGAFAGPEDVAAAGTDMGSAWECPQYAAELGVLFVGTWRPETGPISVQALKGYERKGRLHVEGVEAADHGPDYYAPSLMRAPDGRYLLWGWVREARQVEWWDEVGWAGMLSLPREVSLEAGRLLVRPARELGALRARALPVTAGAPGQVTVEDIPRAFELWVRVETPSRAVCLELEFGHGQVLVVHVDVDNERVVVDRARASVDPRADVTPTVIEGRSGMFADGALEFRLFVDHSVSELFLADGRAATTRFYPLFGSPWRVRLSAGVAGAVMVEAWELRPSVKTASGRVEVR